MCSPEGVLLGWTGPWRSLPSQEWCSPSVQVVQCIHGSTEYWTYLHYASSFKIPILRSLHRNTTAEFRSKPLPHPSWATSCWTQVTSQINIHFSLWNILTHKAPPSPGFCLPPGHFPKHLSLLNPSSHSKLLYPYRSFGYFKAPSSPSFYKEFSGHKSGFLDLSQHLGAPERPPSFSSPWAKPVVPQMLTVPSAIAFSPALMTAPWFRTVAQRSRLLP